MKRILPISCAALMVLSGCPPKPTTVPGPERGAAAPPPATTQAVAKTPATVPAVVVPPPAAPPSPVEPAVTPLPPVVKPASPVVASINGCSITLEQLERPVIEGYGLNVLLHLVQLEMAKRQAKAQGLVVTDEDARLERQRTLRSLFKDAAKDGDEKGVNYEALLDQLLTQQRISRPEYDLAIQTNAYLRKLAEPQVQNKISEENVREAFGIMYGESALARHIQLSNMQEVVEAKRRLDAGEPFEQVAQEMSRNRRTGALGGELPPITRQNPTWPQQFKDALFALKPGEVSEPVQAAGAYHLIKLDKKLEPKAVRYEDVKDTVRAELHERLLQVAMNQLREQFGAEARQSLKIADPVLRQQFNDRLNQQLAQQKNRDEVRREIERDGERQRASSTQPSAVMPSTAPANGPAVNPVAQGAAVPATGAERPPATRPGN